VKRRRAGFALLTVLWVMVAASAVALAGTLAARDNVGTASNRVDAERAAWRAKDCISRARVAADEALVIAQREDATLRVWRALDREVLASPVVTTDGCEIRMEAMGSRLDVNVASARQLVAVFRELDLADPDGLADRLIDWRDPDDDQRLNGAESDWYAVNRRVGPRNGPLADIRELSRVAGFETLDGLDKVLGVEKARISINSASLVVLAAVPGLTAEVLSRIEVERRAGKQIADIRSLMGVMSGPSADSMMAHYPEILELTTVDPEAWTVIARGSTSSNGAPASVVFADARLILGHERIVVTRRRSWQ